MGARYSSMVAKPSSNFLGCKMKMTDDNTPNKRARIPSPQPLGFYDLPDEVLTKVSEYLSSNSRVLLAVALTASPLKWRALKWKIQPSDAAKIILANEELYCNYVSFGRESDEALAAKLTDEDIGGYLACANAVHGVKSFRLVHFKKLVGYGLEPLRSCTGLESIHLCTGEENDAETESILSDDAVIPILESIIEEREKPLYFTLPKKWCVEQSELLTIFLRKYNKLMNSRNISCCMEPSDEDEDGVHCTNICRGTDERPWVNLAGGNFGMHNMTCDSCFDTFCGECATEFTHPCVTCKTVGCKQCEGTIKCDLCQEYSHYECTYIDTCERCGNTTCQTCRDVNMCDICEEKCCGDCIDHLWCQHPGCYSFNCTECADNESDSDYCLVKHCVDCGGTSCQRHLLAKHMKWGEDEFCSICNERAAVELSERNLAFEKWIQNMENKYSGCKHALGLIATTGTFSEQMENRKQLRERCNAIGDRLPMKQKEFESYDYKVKHYDSLDW